MGVVKTAIGLDDLNADFDVAAPKATPAKLPSVKHLTTTTTTTTTTPGPTDFPGTVYVSGLVVLQVAAVIVFGYFVLAAVLTKLCGKRNYWLGDVRYIMRSYFFKLASFHAVLLGMCCATYYGVYKRAGYEEDNCFYFWDFRWMLIVMLPWTMFVYALRYMAFGLASSDNFANKGVQMPNPRVRTDIESGWSADSESYKRVLRNFYTFALIITGVVLLVVFFLLSEDDQTALKKSSICTPALRDSMLDRVVFLMAMMFCANFSAILVEFVLRERTQMDFFGVALNTPFSTTTASTTWLSWFTVAFYLYYFADAFAGQYIMALGYLVVVDTTWYMLLCFLASKTRRV